MIYTSYFANFARYVMNGELNPAVGISIARIMPAKTKLQNDFALAPSITLVSEFKKGKLSEAEYIERYTNETLSTLDPNEVGSKLEGKVLLCYEAIGEFCHRHLVADWLRNAGFEVQELSVVEYKRNV